MEPAPIDRKKEMWIELQLQHVRHLPAHVQEKLCAEFAADYHPSCGNLNLSARELAAIGEED